MKELALVGLGGGAGSILRYLSQRWAATGDATAFPWGTFAVNATGCLLIGILWGAIVRPEQTDHSMRLLLMTGFCGGFTTFSAFTLEGIQLLKEQKTGLFFMYVVASVVLGLLATWIGIKLVR